MTTWRPLAAAALALALACVGAHAHKASDAYLSLQVDGSEVLARMDIALRDLDRDLDLDADADDALSWKEVRTRWPDIAALARTGVRLEAGGQPCVAEPGDAPATDANAPALTAHSDGRYAVVRMRWHCAAPVQRLAVAYDLFARTDPTHRGIVRVSRHAAPAGVDGAMPGAPNATQLAVLSPAAGWHRFTLPREAQGPAIGTAASAASPSSAPAPDASRVAETTLPAPAKNVAADDAAETPGASFAGFVREGIHHILVGYDHILFLLSLLLPAVWVRRVVGPDAGRAAASAGGGWRPAEDLRPALANVLQVVTAFTVAHSITLALAVFEIVDPPSRWIESTIAASVVLAALNNLRPVVSESRWKLTFVFGLVHGFGFASALKDAGLAHGALVAPLVGFNIGVELGQLAIVALVLPLAWTLRGTRTYRGAFAGGSAAIALVAGLWLVQRVFDLRLIAG